MTHSPSSPDMAALADEIEETYVDGIAIDILLSKAEREMIVTALRATQPAAPADEPVAWRVLCTENGSTGYLYTEQMPFEPGHDGIKVRREPDPLYLATPSPIAQSSEGENALAAAEMRRTAAELRANSNGDCNAISQAIMWDRKADARCSAAIGELPEWEDPRVQIVYRMLCDDDLNKPPNPEDHWEGWISRNIVAGLCGHLAQPPSDQLLNNLVDWTWIHATEGAHWPNAKTTAELIRKAKERGPTQEDAGRYIASEGK